MRFCAHGRASDALVSLGAKPLQRLRGGTLGNPRLSTTPSLWSDGGTASLQPLRNTPLLTCFEFSCNSLLTSLLCNFSKGIGEDLMIKFSLLMWVQLMQTSLSTVSSSCLNKQRVKLESHLAPCMGWQECGSTLPSSLFPHLCSITFLLFPSLRLKK